MNLKKIPATFTGSPENPLIPGKENPHQRSTMGKPHMNDPLLQDFPYNILEDFLKSWSSMGFPQSWSFVGFPHWESWGFLDYQ